MKQNFLRGFNNAGAECVKQFERNEESHHSSTNYRIGQYEIPEIQAMH